MNASLAAVAHYTMMARIAALESQNKELASALRNAVEVIKGWHAADEVWDIYYEHSPEMKPIRDALAKVSA